MNNAILEVRAGKKQRRRFLVHHFRNTSNVNVGWVTTTEYTSPYDGTIHHELWTFVVPQFRRQGLGTEMIKTVSAMMSADQKTCRYQVYGSHSNAAHWFYERQIMLGAGSPLNMFRGW